MFSIFYFCSNIFLLNSTYDILSYISTDSVITYSMIMRVDTNNRLNCYCYKTN